MRSSSALALALVLVACPPSQTQQPPEGDGATHQDADSPPADASPRDAAPAGDLDPRFMAAAEALTEAGSKAPRAWNRLAYMTDSFGPRLSGSQGLEKAIDWSLERMREDGLDNVRRQEVMVPHWVRGEEWARVVEPVKRDLTILGIGGTVGTGGRPVRAVVEVIDSLDDIEGRGEALRGKLVVIDQAMPPYDRETGKSGYGEVAGIRFRSASKAGKMGAVAVLARSLTATSLSTPHTGMLRYEEEGPRIPAASLTVEDSADR